MKKKIRADEAFEQALHGEPVPASSEILRMQKLATALSQAATPAAPEPRFRMRLRNELLAAASYEASKEEDLFAAMLEGERVEAPAQMRQLVKVASALEPAALPHPDPAFRFQLRNSLLAAAVPSRSILMRASDAILGWNTRMKRNLRVMGAMSVAVFMLLGAGASLAASRDALPGDLLYPLKRFQESARLVGTTGAERGQQLLGLARVRLSEVDLLLDRGEQEPAIFRETINVMDELTDEGRDLILQDYRLTGDAEPIRYLAAFAREQAADLEVIVLRLPPAARAAAEESLIHVRSIADDAVERLVALCQRCQDLGTPGTVSPSLGSDGSVIGCACEQAGFGTQGGTGGTPEEPGNDNGNPDPGSSPSPGPSPTPTDEPNTVELPDLPGGADEPAEDLIDDIIDPIKSLTPTPVPSDLPSLPGVLPGL